MRGGTGEGGIGAKKRKKPHKSYVSEVEHREDLGGRSEKRKPENVGQGERIGQVHVL